MPRFGRTFLKTFGLVWLLAMGQLVMAQPQDATDPQRKESLKRTRQMIMQAQSEVAQNRLDAAQNSLQQAVHLIQKNNGEHSPALAEPLLILAQIEIAQDDYPKGIEIVERILKIHRHEAPNGWRVAELSAAHDEMTRLAKLDDPARQEMQNAGRQAMQLQGQWQRQHDKKLIEDYKQVLATVRKHVGDTSATTAQLLRDTGILYAGLGDFREACQYLQRAADAYRQCMGQTPKYAEVMYQLSSAQHALGQLDQAEQILLEAARINLSTAGRLSVTHVNIMHQLGLIAYSKASYALAEQRLSEAAKDHGDLVAHQFRSNGFDMPDGVQVNPIIELDRAHLLQSLGDDVAAAKLVARLEDIGTMLYAGTPMYPQYIQKIGRIYDRMSEFGKARRHYLHAKQLFEIRFPTQDHISKAVTNASLASLELYAGEFDSARKYAERALEIWIKVYGEQSVFHAHGLLGVARCLRFAGDLEQAEKHASEAEAILRKIAPAESQLSGNLRREMARVKMARGDASAALEYLQTDLDCKDEFVADVFSMQSERQRLAFLRAQRLTVDLYVTACLADKVPANDFYSRILAWKGSLVDHIRRERQLAADSGVSDALEKLRATRAELAHLAYSLPAQNRQEYWRNDLLRLTEEKEQLERQVAALAPTIANTPTVSLQRLQDALPGDAALIDVLEYRHDAQDGTNSENRMIAFVSRKDQPLRIVDLGSSTSLETIVDRWRATVSDEQETQRSTLKQVDVELFEKVWKPLKPHAQGKQTIFFVPDGPLCSLPLAAIRDGESGRRLIEEAAVVSLVSARHLIHLANDDTTPGQGMIAIGAIDYASSPRQRVDTSLRPSTADTLSRPSSGGFENLPGTAFEIEAVVRDHRIHRPNQPVQTIRGNEATERRVASSLGERRWRYLHFAGHGFFESPSFVSALRANLDGPIHATTLEIEDNVVGFSPALLSGIVMRSTLDDKDQSSYGDGILTAEEIKNFDLDLLDLAVLSACETGLGKVAGGQGVMGLQQSFHMAGANTVVCSMWKVDDAATSLIMEQFYRNLWQHDQTKIQALRQAQLWLLRNPDEVLKRQREMQAEAAKRGLFGYKTQKIKRLADRTAHPSHWAAFVLSGDWR